MAERKKEHETVLLIIKLNYLSLFFIIKPWTFRGFLG